MARLLSCKHAYCILMSLVLLRGFNLCVFLQALDHGGRGSHSKPNFGLISSYYSPWVLEMVLWLPWPLFGAVRLLAGGFPPARTEVCSPGQADWADVRVSNMQPYLKELIKVPFVMCYITIIILIIITSYVEFVLHTCDVILFSSPVVLKLKRRCARRY